MAMKTANEDVYSRIKSASSLIASGVRLKKPDMEAQGRRDFAAAHLENAILVHRDLLTDEARQFLSHLLFDVTDTELVANDPQPAPAMTELDPADFDAPDPDDEYEEDEDDI